MNLFAVLIVSLICLTCYGLQDVLSQIRLDDVKKLKANNADPAVVEYFRNMAEVAHSRYEAVSTELEKMKRFEIGL